MRYQRQATFLFAHCTFARIANKTYCELHHIRRCVCFLGLRMSDLADSTPLHDLVLLQLYDVWTVWDVVPQRREV